MESKKNPFEYEGANTLSDDDLINFYIEDYNFSRFVQSKRNIFLIGERGSGKTMTLLYNSFKIRYKKAKRDGAPIDYSMIGIHVPCNTPLFHKKEYLLLQDEFRRTVICEHFLVLSMIYAIADALSEIDEINIALQSDSEHFFQEIEYLLGIELNRKYNFFSSIKKFSSKEVLLTQRKINEYSNEGFYNNTMSFSSTILPFIETIKSIQIFANSHFMFMIDDAQDMNQYQIRALNSWIAYRDHSHFSFKVATTKVRRPKFITSTGGSILEGHDYTAIDMEKPLQNVDSDFFKLASKIIKKRLDNIGLTDTDTESFFPENPAFTLEMIKCKEFLTKEANEKYPHGTAKQINDHVYKYSRAKYYRDRLGSKANLPPYSGFEMITSISSGIIRNLLDPCYWMYDAVLSGNNSSPAKFIPYSIQNRIIIERSKKLWNLLEEGLDKLIEDCSELQAKQISQLFKNLMILYRARLLKHKSEPRAITFTISQITTHDFIFDKIQPLLDIARKAQLLYTRISRSKDDGKLETYYVPNRLLFPSYGLDPKGQHARASIKVTDLWNAAEKNVQIPFSDDDEDDSSMSDAQHTINFDE